MDKIIKGKLDEIETLEKEYQALRIAKKTELQSKIDFLDAKILELKNKIKEIKK